MDFEFIVKKLIFTLLNKGFTMATAEQCTCGLIGAAVSSQEYPQRWYKGTVTAYSQDSINKLLAVPLYVIEKNGLVSSQVAQQMALDIIYKYCVNIATSVVGDIDGYGKEVQICVAKMDKQQVSFSYKKVLVGGCDKGKKMETIINEALLLTIEHIEGKTD